MNLLQIKNGGNRENYDLCLNCNIGTKKAVSIICDYIEKRKD